MAKKAATTKDLSKPKIDRAEVEAKLTNKKIRGFVWGADNLIGLILADGTTIKFSGFLFG